MAVNTLPVFTKVAANAQVQASAANPNLDGTTGTYYDVVTGAADGTRVDVIIGKAIVTVINGMLRFFYYDGTNTRLIHEEATVAAVPSATVKAATVILSELTHPWLFPLILKSGHKIKVSTEKAETWNVWARAGDLS